MHTTYTDMCTHVRTHTHNHDNFVHVVNRIKAQTGTSVIIPSDTANSDVIRIEGDPKGVKAAKQQLLEIASKMVILPYCQLVPV